MNRTTTPAAGGIQTARIIATALMTGPVMLWTIAWVLTSGGARTIAGGEPLLSPVLAFVAWAGIAAAAFASSLFVRRSALRKSSVGEKGGIMSLLIVSWALLEGSAILSGVLFLIVGLPSLVYFGAGTLFLGMFLTYPRRAWFP